MCFLYRYYLCVSVILDHFAFVFFKLVLLRLVFFQYQAKRLAGKNVSEMTCFVSSGTSNVAPFPIFVPVWLDFEQVSKCKS